jgi:quinoprotein glucose dehydrogenase
VRGTRLLCKQPPYGGIRAIDLKTGGTLWDRALGEASRNGPFGIPSLLPIDIGTPNAGGPIVTAGGLVFIAAATDDLIRAIDIETGRTVWQDKLPAGGQATPMTYEADGVQYLVIMAGGHHFMETPIGDDLVAYAVPKSSSKSSLPHGRRAGVVHNLDDPMNGPQVARSSAYWRIHEQD